MRDFKLKLAQSLVVGRLYFAPGDPIPPATDPSPLWSVVFGEARNALAAVERSIDPADILSAAELIAGAHQVLVFGLGGSSTALAQETQQVVLLLDLSGWLLIAVALRGAFALF